MTYTTFNQTPNDALKEPMFFGQSVNVSRYDQQKFVNLERLIEKQLSFFWRPEEVDVSKDRADWQGLTDSEKHIFISNLKYQTLLDSMAARSVNAVLLPLVSLPELETWVETWAFSETIHSRSYTHILRNLFTDPSEVFDDIVVNPAILKRASSIAKYFDDVIISTQLFQSQGEGSYQVEGKTIEVSMRSLKEKLYLAICSVNALEAIRFYVSFACSFAFAERELLEGNAKIIKLIARDEALHLTGTQTILNLWASGDGLGIFRKPAKIWMRPCVANAQPHGRLLASLTRQLWARSRLSARTRLSSSIACIQIRSPSLRRGGVAMRCFWGMTATCATTE